MDSDEDVAISRGCGRHIVSLDSDVPTTATSGSESDVVPTPTATEQHNHGARPTQTSTLAHLPQELQDNILHYVASEDLNSLSRTCLALRSTSLPFMNEDITLTEEPQHAHLLRTLYADPKLASYVKTIRFRKTRARADLPREILSLTSNVTSLEYDYHLDQWGGVCEHVLGPHLARTLNSIKATLTQVRITYNLDVEGGEFARPGIKGPCSLIHLLRLKSLYISWYILLGWVPEDAPSLAKVLPARLEHFTAGQETWWNNRIRWRMPKIWIALVSFIVGKQWKITCPNLHRLDVEYLEIECTHKEEADEGMHYEGEREFKQLCKENGLECQIFRLYLER